MFRKLKNRIVIITMLVTTAVLILSGSFIMLFSSTMRPEPKPEPNFGVLSPEPFNEKELKGYIESDRKEGNARLLVTLIFVGLVIEVAVFLIVHYSSQKIIEPVKDSYEKQKLFIANASHELKTPLAIIQANIEALDVDKKNEKWKENIESEVTHANKLVLNLLELAKMDAGSSEKSAPEKIDLEKDVKTHVELFRPKFSGEIVLESDMKQKFVLLRKRDFLEVLDILLDNATKYGEKKISVFLKNDNLAIKNDGKVIKSADCEKVFERFYQTDKSSEGSGLGLAIAKAICEKNNWEIRCENEGKKTSFSLSF